MLLMKIADRQNKSLEFIMENYTDTEVGYWRVYLSKEPDSTQMNEFLFTQLLAMTHQINSKNSKLTAHDFRFPNQWKTKNESDVDLIKQMLTGK
jgi:hypothetical protein